MGLFNKVEMNYTGKVGSVSGFPASGIPTSGFSTGREKNIKS